MTRHLPMLALSFALSASWAPTALTMPGRFRSVLSFAALCMNFYYYGTGAEQVNRNLNAPEYSLPRTVKRDSPRPRKAKKGDSPP